MSSFLGGFFNSLNYSTDIVSGAIDIVVVRQPDEELKCTPFHVRFGRWKLLRSKEKLIRIMVNGKLTSLCMKVGEAGEAYFVKETEGPVRAEFVSSPLASPAVSPTEMLKQVEEHHRLQAEAEQQFQQQMELHQQEGQMRQDENEPLHPHQPPQIDHDEIDPELAGISEQIARDNVIVEKHDADGHMVFRPITPTEQAFMNQLHSESNTLTAHEDNHDHTNHHGHDNNDNNHVVDDHLASNKPSNWSWMWGELPVKFGSWFGFQKNANGDGTMGEDFINATPNSYREQQFLETLVTDYHYDAVQKTYTDQKSPLSDGGSKNGISSNNSSITGGPSSPERKQPSFDTKSTSSKGASELVSLRSFFNDGPVTKAAETKNHSPKQKTATKEIEEEDLLLDDEDDDIISEHDDAFDFDTLGYDSPNLEPLGEESQKEASNAIATEKKDCDLDDSTIQMLSSSLTPSLPPHMTSSKDSNDHHVSRSFDNSFLKEQFERIQREKQQVGTKQHNHSISSSNSSSNSSSVDLNSEKHSPNGPTSSTKLERTVSVSSDEGWRSSTSSALSDQTKRSSWRAWLGLGRNGQVQSQEKPLELEKQTSPVFFGEEGEIIYTKTLRPSGEQLEALNLKEGRNEIQFIVTSRFQGTQELAANIYLWNHDSRLVISDVDGTITRSDALGHILPMIGRDWSHAGIAKLYSTIKSNGYKFLYLTSRSIVQAGQTRGYIASLKQGGSALPEGPVIMAPDRLFEVITREVITKRPEEFKIAALRDIRALFPTSINPYVGGFGNKVNDVTAYRTVGVPLHKIFTIDPTGAIRVYGVAHEGYTSVQELASHIFPAIKENEESVDKMFSSWNFFKCNDMSILDGPLEL